MTEYDIVGKGGDPVTIKAKHIQVPGPNNHIRLQFVISFMERVYDFEHVGKLQQISFHPNGTIWKFQYYYSHAQ